MVSLAVGASFGYFLTVLGFVVGAAVAASIRFSSALLGGVAEALAFVALSRLFCWLEGLAPESLLVDDDSPLEVAGLGFCVWAQDFHLVYVLPGFGGHQSSDGVFLGEVSHTPVGGDVFNDHWKVLVGGGPGVSDCDLWCGLLYGFSGFLIWGVD